LRRAAALLVEPVPAIGAPATMPVEVVVTGLSAGAGATTVCRGLAIALRRHGADVTEVGASGAVAAGPGTTVVRDVPPSEAARPRCGRAGCVLVTVADGRREPELATLVAAVLARRHEHVVLVANWVADASAWAGHGAVCIPESRLAALLVGRGRRPPGAMGAGFDALALQLQAGSPRGGTGAEARPQAATITLKPP
jgi:hypothetical protein